ncbi:hypothetical protein BDV98DRAFT_570058 [Pterulicium gracile]|uniref:F-box domain-containing protein n=1 Tax=Pterulicium gracile TaxID=1884261 RepID=A0A5C3QFY5_9AGAR|nr:hypothetical protein BDV98DRAFT_570058 [Pterula gracilis]
MPLSTMSSGGNSVEAIQNELENLSGDVAIRALDQHITQADPQADQTHLRRLRELRNRYCPIATIPPELLGAIFMDAVRPPDNDYYAVVPWKERVAISSVCSNWRAVALDTAGFWVNFGVCTSPNFASMVARSKEMPISVRLSHLHPFDGSDLNSYNHDELSAAFSLLFKASRLQEFHILGDKEEIEYYLEHIPHDEPTPLLRSIIVQATVRHLPPSIPQHIIRIRKPLLRYLTLDTCEVPWPTPDGEPLLANLLHLHLLHTEPRPPSDILLDVLRASPGLLALQLEDTIPLDLDPTCDFSLIIPLDFLELYMITDTTALSTKMYTHTSHPRTTSLFIHVPQYARGISNDMIQEQHTISAFLDVHGLAAHSAAQRVLPRDDIDLSLSHVPGVRGVLLIHISSPTGMWTYQLVCTHANLAFALGALRVPGVLKNLVFETDSSVQGADWIGFFEKHGKEVEKVTFGEGFLNPGVLGALSARVDSRAIERPIFANQGSVSDVCKDQGQVILLPNLSLLVIHKVAVTESTYSSLLAMLRFRRDHGNPVRTVKIDRMQPALTDGMIGKLEEIVGAGGVIVRRESGQMNYAEHEIQVDRSGVIRPYSPDDLQ